MFFKYQKLIFVHIPKTGGNSVERYVNQRFHLGLDLVDSDEPNLEYLWKGMHNKHSLQHCSLHEIFELKSIDARFPRFKIFTVVRNPYHRCISALVFWGLLTTKNKENLKPILLEFLGASYEKYDTHNIPQYKFIEINGKIPKYVRILKTEKLKCGMFSLGFQDFNFHCFKKKEDICYESLLTPEIKEIIYEKYHRDFELFGYLK